MIIGVLRSAVYTDPKSVRFLLLATRHPMAMSIGGALMDSHGVHCDSPRLLPPWMPACQLNRMNGALRQP